MNDISQPPNEVERMHAVRRYGILDTAPEEVYDRITGLVARVFQVPVAIVSIVDQDRIWFKSHYGLNATQIPRSVGLCASAILQNEPYIIKDAASDTQASTNPVIEGGFVVRFYVGVPLTTPDGFNLGTLCLIDTKPHMLSAKEISNLQDLAWLVMEQLELRLEATEAEVKLTSIKSSSDNVVLAQKEFASTLVHELRSPLNSILGFTQLLKRDNPSSSQLSKIQQILHAGWHQTKLIDDFFDLAVLKSGMETLTQESLPLFDVLDECRGMMKPQAQIKDIHLHFSHSTSPLSVYADRTKLKQVLINLLSNAIKYTPVAGKVTVEWEKKSSARVRVSIKDTGIGIAAEKMDQLFQPFNRLGQEAGPEEGVGIGLTVTKKLVEMMGGTIGVDSTEGAGSTFWIELILAEAATLSQARSIPRLDDASLFKDPTRKNTARSWLKKK